MEEESKKDLGRVVERVRKLLERARAGGAGSEVEAAQAAAMAQELLLKHNLDAAEVEASGLSDARERVKEDAGEAAGGNFRWRRELAEQVASSCFCAVLETRAWEERDERPSFGEGHPTTARARELRDLGLSLNEIARELKAEGRPTPGGKDKWSSTTVQRALGGRRRVEVAKRVVVGRRANVAAAKVLLAYLVEAVERGCPYNGSTHSGYSWKEGCSDRLQQRLWRRRRELVEAHDKRARAEAEERTRRLAAAAEARRLEAHRKSAREVEADLRSTAREGGATAPAGDPKCVWCAGGFVAETGVMCRQCGGTGKARAPEPDPSDGWVPGEGASPAGDLDLDVDLDGLVPEPEAALVLASEYTQAEEDANWELAHGLAPGTCARWRAQRAEEARKLAAERAAETPEDRASREARERKAAERVARSSRLARRRELEAKDPEAYRAGAEAGERVGLDPQLPGARGASRLGGES